MLPDWTKEIEGSLSKIRSHIVETPTFETSSFGQKVDLNWNIYNTQEVLSVEEPLIHF